MYQVKSIVERKKSFREFIDIPIVIRFVSSCMSFFSLQYILFSFVIGLFYLSRLFL